MPFGRFLKTLGAGILLVIGGYLYVHKPAMPQAHFDIATLEKNTDAEGEHVPADFLSDIASTTATSSVSTISSTSSISNLPGQGQPPQEAIDACAGHAVGASCTVQTSQGSMAGTCSTPSSSSSLACIPK